MKTILKVLLFIPRLICEILWNLFWGLLKLVLIVGIVVFGLVYYANHSSSDLASNISVAIENVSSYFNGNGTADLKENLSNLSTDTTTNSDGSRWNQASATVYIQSTNETLVAVYQDAISVWNKTGAFTFTVTTDAANADIIATDQSDASSQAAGVADTQTNLMTNRITHVDVKLNSYYLLDDQYGYTYERIVNTAEHELGHAIGLEHDDAEDSVMQSAGSYYGIQQVDIDRVTQLYAS
ncbi:matrixin family metalloprotease [Streptococcus dentiloxodontae]